MRRLSLKPGAWAEPAMWLHPYGASAAGLPLRRMKEAGRRSCSGRTPSELASECVAPRFGSYHLASFPDAATLALQMGNSPAMIFKHYRELVKLREAAAHWNIRPALADNVRAITA